MKKLLFQAITDKTYNILFFEDEYRGEHSSPVPPIHEETI